MRWGEDQNSGSEAKGQPRQAPVQHPARQWLCPQRTCTLAPQASSPVPQATSPAAPQAAPASRWATWGCTATGGGRGFRRGRCHSRRQQARLHAHTAKASTACARTYTSGLWAAMSRAEQAGEQSGSVSTSALDKECAAQGMQACAACRPPSTALHCTAVSLTLYCGLVGLQVPMRQGRRQSSSSQQQRERERAPAC